MSRFVTYRVHPTEPYGPRWKEERPHGLPEGVRKCSERGAAKPYIEKIARGHNLSPAFVGVILSLAHNETGGSFVFALPANNFDIRPPEERPRIEQGSRYDQYPSGGDGVQDLISAWGIFQYNRGAWQRLARERRGDVDGDLSAPVSARPAHQNPWDATAWEELAYPIAWYARIFEQAKREGAPDLAAARAIRVYHSGPAHWRRYRDIGFTDNWDMAWDSVYSPSRAASVAEQFAMYGVT